LNNGAGIPCLLPLHFFMDRYIESYINKMRAFVECVIEDKAPPVNGRDGRAPVLIGLAAKRFLLERRPVWLQEVDQPALSRK